MDDTTTLMDMNLSKLLEIVEGRKSLNAAVPGVHKRVRYDLTTTEMNRNLDSSNSINAY